MQELSHIIQNAKIEEEKQRCEKIRHAEETSSGGQNN